jgi:hypothetical protein
VIPATLILRCDSLLLQLLNTLSLQFDLVQLLLPVLLQDLACLLETLERKLLEWDILCLLKHVTATARGDGLLSGFLDKTALLSRFGDELWVQRGGWRRCFARCRLRGGGSFQEGRAGGGEAADGQRYPVILCALQASRQRASALLESHTGGDICMVFAARDSLPMFSSSRQFAAFRRCALLDELRLAPCDILPLFCLRLRLHANNINPHQHGIQTHSSPSEAALLRLPPLAARAAAMPRPQHGHNHHRCTSTSIHHLTTTHHSNNTHIDSSNPRSAKTSFPTPPQPLPNNNPMHPARLPLLRTHLLRLLPQHAPAHASAQRHPAPRRHLRR